MDTREEVWKSPLYDLLGDGYLAACKVFPFAYLESHGQMAEI